MIKRPLNSQFSQAVLEGRKVTTIRDNAWPVGVPIMLYNWSGAAYRTPQLDVCPVEVERVGSIHIAHDQDGNMTYAYPYGFNGVALHQTEGFASREELDNWFRPLVKRGQTITKALMNFRRMEVKP